MINKYFGAISNVCLQQSRLLQLSLTPPPPLLTYEIDSASLLRCITADD